MLYHLTNVVLQYSIATFRVFPTKFGSCIPKGACSWPEMYVHSLEAFIGLLTVTLHVNDLHSCF